MGGLGKSSLGTVGSKSYETHADCALSPPETWTSRALPGTARGGGGGAPAKIAMKLLSKTPVKIPAGGTARVEISIHSKKIVGRFQFDLNNPPEGIAIQSVSPSNEMTDHPYRPHPVCGLSI